MKIFIAILISQILTYDNAKAASFLKNGISTLSELISDIANPFDIEDYEAPSYSVLVNSEQINKINGHENLGFLSRKAGFLPLFPSIKKLPAAFEAWEQLADNLPLEISQQTLRKNVECLPTLNTKDIPDDQLQRAATILSVLAHSYAHSSLDAIKAIPDSIYIPWSEISCRLSRGNKPYMNYIDLIVFNWKTNSDTIEDIDYQQISIENLELLIPTVNNQEEKVFYLTQVEILAKTSKIVELIAMSQTFALNDDPVSLTETLNEIDSILKTVQGSIKNINPREESDTFVDPIVWAKTVAPLAVPLEKGPPGPSGTSSPFFHMFDTFIDRNKYESDLGLESLAIRKTFPTHWNKFINAVNEVSIDNYILSKRNNPELVSAWRKIKETYYGKILGFHKKKVFAYITHAFKTGRNNTIGGYEGNTREDGASKVDDALQNSRRERIIGCPFSRVAKIQCPHSTVDDYNCCPHEFFSISDIVENNGINGTKNFFIAQGIVYDATAYLSKHPGGASLIKLCSGRDITNELGRVSHLEGSIKTFLKKYQIGLIKEPQFENENLEQLYAEVKKLAFYLSEVEAIYHREIGFLNKNLYSVNCDAEYSPYKKNLFAGTAVRFSKEFMPAIFSKFENIIRDAKKNDFDDEYLLASLDQLSSVHEKSDLIVQSSYLGFTDHSSDIFEQAEISDIELEEHINIRVQFISDAKSICLDLLRSLECSNTSTDTKLYLSRLCNLMLNHYSSLY